MTRAPLAASARAVARPMPREAPVTSAVLLMRSVMIVLRSGMRNVWKIYEAVSLRSSLAAVDVDDLAGDERRPARGDEHDRVGDLFGPAGALQRHACHQAGFPVGVAGEAIEHRGLDRPRRHRIDTDAERGGFQRRPGPWSTTN